MGREVAARRLAPHEALNADVRRLGLDLVLSCRRSQFLELQFHLVEQSLAALRTWAKVLALHLRDHQLEVLDQCLRPGELRARLDQRRSERIHIVGKRISYARHARMESQDAALVILRSCFNSKY